jgi:hypothetical protein
MNKDLSLIGTGYGLGSGDLYTSATGIHKQRGSFGSNQCGNLSYRKRKNELNDWVRRQKSPLHFHVTNILNIYQLSSNFYFWIFLFWEPYYGYFYPWRLWLGSLSCY